MRASTIGILLIVLVVLLPTWFAAAQPVEQGEDVRIETEETDMRPLQSIIDTPDAFTPAQVGVVIWLALGALLGVLVVVHQFMDHMVRPSERVQPFENDGVPSWLQMDDRWIVEYLGARESQRGMYVILGLMGLTVVIVLLLVTEFLTLARTQYVGLFVGGIFLGLAGMTAAYYAWFLPHIHLAEGRYHE